MEIVLARPEWEAAARPHAERADQAKGDRPEPTRSRDREAGFDAHLAKPADPERIRALVLERLEA